MPQFFDLIGQIFIIACVGSVMDFFIDETKKPYISKVVNIACYAASFYLVIKFVFDNLISEVLSVFSTTF